MRRFASWLLAAAPFVYGCATKCDMTRWPDELNNPNMTVSFFDGSANGYVFSVGNVEYRPVKREESSSGRYSGGEPFKRAIDAPTYAKIANAMNAAIDAKATHIQNRTMLSGVISIRCGDASRDWIIAPGSAELSAIEELMDELKAGGTGSSPR
ncbi:MAG: hypothetical protein IPM54_09695 [Polyangiaceae bacterium]|nr:hypothetical protein [Polyangiaceae bacterium]